MATTPLASKLTAPLQPLPQQPRGAERASRFPSEEGRTPLSRGMERGSLFPPEQDARQPMLRGVDQRSSSFPPEEVRPPMSRGSERVPYFPPEDGMQQLSRATERLALYQPEDGRSQLSRNAERSIFLTSDDHALTRQIEQQHRPDGRRVNVRPLFHLVEDIIYRGTQTVEGQSVGAVPLKDSMEGRLTLNGLEEVPESALIIERISCEMTCKILSGADAHHITLSVLNMLPHFTWETKVVLTLAAFALTFGDFWLLVQIYSTNPLAKSMALIKRLPVVMEHRGAYTSQFESINNLLRAILDTTRCIIEFAELPATYITDEDREVRAALAHFPIIVYSVVRSIVAAATQITTLSSRGFESVQATAEAWELSNWTHKLKTISDHLRNTLSKLYRLIDEKKELDYYKIIKIVIYQTIHVDNMKVLTTLLGENMDVPPLYDCPNKRRVHLDVLRTRNVLLLISGLDISHEELYILEQSYTESKLHAFEIVWIPVVDRTVPWTDSMQVQFETLQASMPWYSVHQPLMIHNAVIKFFRDDWHFRGKPILVVLDPWGKVVSPNAIHMMWIWQSNAFPFSSKREEDLWKQETWRLELLVNGIDPTVTDWIREEKFIFVYGGDDIEWIRKFTKEVQEVALVLRIPVEMVYVGKSHHKEQVRKLCATIVLEQLSRCWQDPAQVWYFWTRIESMISSKIQLDKFNDHNDIILQEIQRLHSYDKAHGGWAVLAKGSHIVIHGHGRLALMALIGFDRDRAAKEGFDKVYKEYYNETYMKENPCHRIEFPSTVKVPPSMLCPDCRNHMKQYNTFICCHENDAYAAYGAEVPPPMIAPAPYGA